MTKVLRTKRGVSPLIATVLLIAFAVSLGSVVINWGLNLDIGGQDPCRKVELNYRKLSDAGACFGGFGANGYIQFILDNVGNVDIRGLLIGVSGTKGTSSIDLENIEILSGEVFDKRDEETKYDFLKYGNIKEIQMIPKVLGENTIKLCPKKAIRIDEVGPCS